MDRGKGKQVAGSDSSFGGKKRKGLRDEGLRISKRKKPAVLQFSEDPAEVGYRGGSFDGDGDDFDMEVDPEKGIFPEEEEYDRIMEESYDPGSGFVRYADNDVKSSIEMDDAIVPTKQDSPIWKVKCAIGRERHSVFCLMHKFFELRKIGTKLQILSVEHVKGFIFIEADKEHDVLEVCKSLNGIYATRMMLLPIAEAPRLLTIQRKANKKSEGTWALVKNGKYKGDLAQVVAVSDTRGKALIKLIIDMGALTQKYLATLSSRSVPAPRLMEVSVDSLSSWRVIPSKEDILKFTPAEQKEPGDVEWISEIYGQKKKNILPAGSVGGKGEESGGEKVEGSSGSTSESSYEFYNLVCCFSRKDLGLIVGVDDKGDGYKVLEGGTLGVKAFRISDQAQTN